MKSILIILSLISHYCFACPDISGEYRRVDSGSCKMFGVKNMRSTPFFPFSVKDKQDSYISDGETFKIDQKNCSELTFSYQGDAEELRTMVDLSFGTLKTTENSITVKNLKARTICYFGCQAYVAKEKITIKKLDDQSLTIKASYFDLGAFLYFIPTSDIDKINCNFERIN